MTRTIVGLVATTLLVGVYGCSRPSPSEPAAPASSPSAAHGEHGDHAADGHTGQSDMNKMMSELAKLSPADRASAEKQHVCPVSGEMLGTMGAPKRIEVNREDVWICCDGCKNQLLANPDKYLAKLHQK